MNSKITSDGLAEQLTKLSKLHTEGVLSADEFKALKAKLIAGMNEDTGAKKKDTKNITDEVSRRIDNASQFIASTELVKKYNSDFSTSKKIVYGGIGVIGIGVLWLVYFSSGGISDLKVESMNQDGMQFVSITNLAQASAELKNVIINNQAKCTKGTNVFSTPGATSTNDEQARNFLGKMVEGLFNTLPVNLNMGESKNILNFCGSKIVEATIVTNRGTATYTWK